MAGAVRRLVLAGETNPFSLGTEALNFVDERIRRLRPNAVLEFGSGVSTLVLTSCMVELHGNRTPRVFSVDESEDYLHATERMLAAADLDRCARLAHRRVREQPIRGQRVLCYDVDDDFLRTFMTAAPDFLLVDGPSGGGMVRFGTLPLVVGHVGTPCRFLLDDALREDELLVASRWQKLPDVRLIGIHLVGHGLLEGVVVRQG